MSMLVDVSTSIDNSEFILTPLNFSITEIRGIGIYAKTINGGYRKDESIIIPINESDVHFIYAKIKQLFENRLGCELQFDTNAGSVVSGAEDEARKFAEFSSKAMLIRNNDISNDELEDFTRVLTGNHFKRTLKPFQLLSAYHLAFSQNACNFSVPGSGKTTAVLAAYDYLKHTDIERKHVDKLLVVGPLAAFIAWKGEFKECYGREPKVFEIRGGVSYKQVEDRLLKSNVEEDIIIASYGSLDGKKDIINHFLKNNRTMVVLDEAHRIKNVEDGVQSYAALSLSAEAKSRVILTGTPAANSYVDLYNLYKFIWPSNNIIRYSKTQLATMSKVPNDNRVADLIDNISPFFVRVRKSDLNLPEPIFNKPYTIVMQTVQQKIYDSIAQMAVKSFENSSLSTVFKKSALIRMRQAATNPNLLNKSLDDYYDSLDGDYFTKTRLNNSIDVEDDVLKLIRSYKHLEVPSKFIATKDLSNRIISSGGKLLIWCEFIGTCQDLNDYLKSQGIANEILYGGTPQEERERIIVDFQKNDSVFKVVIANPHAVGESISLHKSCHNALYLEQGYNAGSYMQSKDRIHRVGLEPDDETNYYFFQSSDTLDATIYERVVAKENRMLEIIENEEIPLLINNADYLEDTDDDIKAIIRGYYDSRRELHI